MQLIDVSSTILGYGASVGFPCAVRIFALTLRMFCAARAIPPCSARSYICRDESRFPAAPNSISIWVTISELSRRADSLDSSMAARLKAIYKSSVFNPSAPSDGLPLDHPVSAPLQTWRHCQFRSSPIGDSTDVKCLIANAACGGFNMM